MFKIAMTVRQSIWRLTDSWKFSYWGLGKRLTLELSTVDSNWGHTNVDEMVKGEQAENEKGTRDRQDCRQYLALGS